jgi:L-lactate transport
LSVLLAGAEIYHQNLNPLGNAWLSTLVAALPVVALFVFLVPMRWLAPKAALGGAVTALLAAVFAFGMPWEKSLAALGYGMAFGLLPVGWNILFAMFLYNITVETGQFTIIRRSVASVSPDVRIQAILIGFCFGAFLEGAAGGGTPVAICGAIMVGLGFKPFQAAVLCLIANTSPVAYGGLGSPLIVLGGVTGLNTDTLSIMAGHQLPIFSCIIPIWMVKCMCSWRQTWEVLPAVLVAGVSFAAFQFTFATIHAWVPGVYLYNMTDIGGGIFSLLATALFLKGWQPKTVMRYAVAESIDVGANARQNWAESVPLTPGRITLAWFPYVLMSVALLGAGLIRQEEQRRSPKTIEILGSLLTNYLFEVPALQNSVYRDARLLLNDQRAKPEPAIYELAWITSAGSAVLAAALVSMLLLRMNGQQIWNVIKKTVWQMRIPIPTIALMLGLSYVTRFSGMDAALGFAFAGTGVLYPFFAAILGWLGVFLTGTDAGSNALFGSLQKIAAAEVYQHHSGLFGSLDLSQAQVLICTSNSTGGVMGKMIDAQSICVATAATHQIGKEADIFKAVVWHSLALASLMGGLVLLQAYVWPFQGMVPK